MRKFLIATTIACLAAFASTAGATNFGNRTYNNANSNAYSVGQGGAGGNASATGGNASSSSSARGGSAYVGNSNSVRGTNRQSQGQSQANRQGQYQGNVGINGQSLSGLGSGNDTSVNVEGDTVTYKAAPIAPNAAPGNPTAPCIATFSGSAGTAIVSLGASGFVRDNVCTWGEVSRVAREAGNKKVANDALMLMFEEAERQTGTIASLKEAAKPVSSDTGFETLDSYAD